jgi:subtilase family serine protease
MTFAQGPPSQIITPGGKVIVPPSSVEQDSDEGFRAHTNHIIFLSDKPQVTGSVPAGENPGSLACVYNIVNPSLNPGCLSNPSSTTFANPIGGSGTIVIVDAYDYPTAYADLTAFSNQFGLPVPPLCNGSNAPCFAISYASGQKPSVNCGWNQEAALDIEWAHAMAPGASIVLVEAASSSFSDLLTGVDAATSIIQNGVVNPGSTTGQVSMSWGGNEFRGETSYDYHFDHKGVAYFAAAGDTAGKTIWPGVSPNVVSAGGTRVNRDSSGNFISESAWSRETCGGGPCGGGGGPSRYESRPSYQDAVSSIVGRSRGTPDFSFDGDPYTGVSVYGPMCSGSNPSAWMVFGGTSVSSPALAGIVNLAGHNQDTGSKASSFAEQRSIYTGYPNYGSSTFRDITSGNNGYAAQSGWDFATGIGSDQGLTGK